MTQSQLQTNDNTNSDNVKSASSGISIQNTAGGIAKQSLGAHRWLGLLVSAFMYIICLTGTLAVFDQEFERWEQPHVPEGVEFTPALAAKAYSQFTQQYTQETSHRFMVFPEIGIPRLVMEDDHRAHFVNQDGSLGEIESAPWTKMLIDLHYYLHMPETFGMILVSTLGAVLCALVISGLLAHPRIIKDAFRFRRGGTGMQENIDLHNRLSVWATPFHLLIGITGAYFGLATIFILIVATVFEGGDRNAALAKFFTPEPILKQSVAPANIEKALTDLAQRNPDGKRLFLTVHEPDTPEQFIEIYVQQPQRLIFSENYRYDTNGNFIERSGYSDGETGKQFIYSIYRAHFGDFAGIGSKLLYFVLGMMLTVVSATGINIWLHKRKTVDIVNILWPAFVWFTPIALCMSALSHILLGKGIYPVFWCALLFGVVAVSKYYKNYVLVSAHLKMILAMSMTALVLVHSITNIDAISKIALLQVNLSLLLLAALFSFSSRRMLKQHRQ